MPCLTGKSGKARRELICQVTLIMDAAVYMDGLYNVVRPTTASFSFTALNRHAAINFFVAKSLIIVSRHDSPPQFIVRYPWTVGHD